LQWGLCKWHQPEAPFSQPRLWAGHHGDLEAQSCVQQGQKKMGNSLGTGRGCEKGAQGVTTNKYGVFFGGNKSVLKLNRSRGSHTVNVLNSTELYAFNG
jgi:hypothetical protein